MTAIRSSFWLAERTSPALGARWASALWFTLPANGHRPAAATGEPFAAPFRSGASGWGPGLPRDASILSSDLPPNPSQDRSRDLSPERAGGGRIAGEEWGDGPAVYLLHGWGGHRGQLRALVDPLVAAGYRVIAFDAPSHGASPPGPSGRGRSTLYEVADALAEAVAVGGPAHGLIAHSAGCVSAAMAMRAGLAVPRVAFVAPVADFGSYLPVFAGRLGLGPRVLTRAVRRIEQRVGRPLGVFDIRAMAPALADAGAKLLLVHDRDDPETMWSGSKEIGAAWPGARLHSTTGLGHRRILRDPQVISEVTAFMAHPATTPSVAPGVS